MLFSSLRSVGVPMVRPPFLTLCITRYHTVILATDTQNSTNASCWMNVQLWASTLSTKPYFYARDQSVDTHDACMSGKSY